MTGNAPPFVIKVLLYPGSNPALPDSWGLPEDVSSFVRYPGNDGGQAITYSAGRGDEAAQVDAGSMTLTFDNRDGRFSTKNALGRYYGKLRRNTPIVMGMDILTDTFTRTVAVGAGTADTGQTYDTGLYWSTNGTKLVSTTPNPNVASRLNGIGATSDSYEISFTTTPTVALTGGPMSACGVQTEPNPVNYFLYRADFMPDNTIQVRFHRVGTAVGSQSYGTTTVPGLTWAPNQTFRVRCQRHGFQVRMKVWLDGTTEPAAWSISGIEQYVKPGTLGVFIWRQSSNTNAGNVVQLFDDLNIMGIEFVGLVSQWPARWDKTGKNCWAPIQANGILRRLQQGKGPLRSPLTRQLPAYSPTGYWTLEDDSGADAFGSSVANVPAAAYGGVSPAGDSSLAGGGSAPTWDTTNGFIRFTTAKRVGGGVKGFSAMFFTKFPNGWPTSKTIVATITSTGTATRWVFSIDVDSTYVDSYNSNGDLLSSANNLFSPSNPAEWVAWQLETDVSGSTTNWSMIQHQVGRVDFYAQTGSFASTASSSVTGIVLGASNLPTGTAFAHVWVGPNTLPFVTEEFSLVSSGYAGELASNRIARLCLEEGIPVGIEPGVSDPLGVQPQSNILQALRMAADGDLGILYERAAGLGYRPRSARYNQAVAMNLAVSAGQIDDPPEPIEDDQRLRNRWTVSRDGGSYAVAEDTDSINAEGLYEDSISLSVFTDGTLLNQAGWRVHMGTWPDLRWPNLSIDLARNPSLISAWRGRIYGFRMQVTTSLTQVRGSDPDVIVEGYTGTLWPHGWKVGMNCSTATVWTASKADDTGSRADQTPGASTLVLPVVAGATSLQVATSSAGLPWSTTAVPFNIVVSGEIMTVTNVAGTASPQTFTVVRGVAGFGKDIGAGEAVQVSPRMYAIY